MDFFLDQGLDINAIKFRNDPESYSTERPFRSDAPLEIAVQGGDVEMNKYLLSKGANPLIRDPRHRRLPADVTAMNASATIESILRPHCLADNPHKL